MTPEERALLEQDADEELRQVKLALADVVAHEEQRVQNAIADDVRAHERVLTRSRELGNRRVFRAG